MKHMSCLSLVYRHYFSITLHVTKFDHLLSLIVADHVKPMLHGDCLKYILSVENTTDAGWLPHRKLAEVIDTYIASHTPDSLSQAHVSHVSNIRHNKVGDLSHRVQQTTGTKNTFVTPRKPERRCFECDSRLHVVKHCPYRQKSTIRSSSSYVTAKPNTQKPSRVFVNTTSACSAITDNIDTETTTVKLMNHEATTLHVSVDDQPEVHSSVNISETDVPHKPLHKLDIHAVQHEVEVANLSYITVIIDGVQFPVKALHDSGAQISVIHPEIIKDILPYLPREGTVKLKGLFGDAVDAELISLTVKQSNVNGDGISVIMAMSDKVNNGLNKLTQLFSL